MNFKLCYALVSVALVISAAILMPNDATAQTNTFPTSGNAGVGTTTPTLQTGTTNTMVEVKGTVNPGVGLTSTSAGGRQFFVYSAQANPGYFSIFDATATADRFVINSSGNVGIGTANVNTNLIGTFSYPSGRIVQIDATQPRLIVRGSQDAGIDLINVGAAANAKWMQLYSASGVTKFRSVDDSLNVKDVLVMDNSTGNVGIGTSTPVSNLQIGTQASASSVSPIAMSLGGSYSSSAGANLKLKLYDDGVTANTYGIGVSSGSMDFGVSPGGGYHWYAGGASKMTLANNGDLSVTGVINAKYQDVAEWVPSTQQLSAGTVVVLDQAKSNQVIASSSAYDTRVAGVISAQPGITLGEKSDDKVLVATTGRVHVKVDASKAPIQIGDLLVTSDVPGVAMKSEPVEFAGRKMHMPGTIIGKALEPLAKGSGEILVLLSLQ